MKVAVALLLIAPFLRAQETTPLVRTNTRVVLLDVTVTDKTGKPVRALTQDDFTVIENGVPQKISSFEGPRPDPAGTPQPNAPRTVILIDQLNINFGDLSYARDRILLFIAQNHWEHNLTALMAIGPHGLVVIQDYTQDQALLKQKLVQFRPAMANAVEGTILQEQVAEHARQAVGVLLDIARASVGASYNLNLIWVTNGFGGTIRSAKNADGSQNGIRRLAGMLTAARLRLYTINPSGNKPLEATMVATPMISTHSGLYSGQSMSDASVEEDMASQSKPMEPDRLMETLATLTGGRAFYGRNDVEVALSQAVADGNSNYTLSYAPSNSDFKGEYRKIEIRADVPDLTARTRLGYYALADDSTHSTDLRNERWNSALTGPLAYTAFTLTCPITYNAETGEAKGNVTSRPTPIIMQAQQESIQVVRAAALSNSGAMLTGWSWQIDWKKTWTNRLSTVSFDKVLPKKTKSIRFLVSDPAAEHIGTCDFPLP